MGVCELSTPESKYASVAVCVPCYNEALTIAGVIDGFRRHLTGCQIYVFDNNSSDGTAQVARQNGAEVYLVQHQGKGNVVRRAFADVEADVYILVDGDGTYDPAAAPAMVDKLLTERLDMVVGCREEDASDKGKKYRSGHSRTSSLDTGRFRGAM
jgi:glycosyltransferase involved in cell wall biosynthesis